MQKYNWNYPTTIWVGENRINDIAIACKSLGITKPLLVTDKGLADSNILKNTLSILNNQKINNAIPTLRRTSGQHLHSRCFYGTNNTAMQLI